MIYPVDYESKIGFDRIRAQVRERCTTEGGRMLPDRQGFSASAAGIDRRRALCAELAPVLMMGSGFPPQE